MAIKKNELIAFAKARIAIRIKQQVTKKLIFDLEREYEQNWYEKQYGKDFSFYSDELYLPLVLNCFEGWTAANTSRAIMYLNTIKYVPKSILDFGAGIGLSTALIASAFPETKVLYQNVPSAQWDIAKMVFDYFELDNVEMTYEQFPTADVVLAFEVMEHFYEPLKVVEKILANANYMIDSSSFSFRSIGHFNYYLIGDDAEISNMVMKARMTKFLRSIGFEKSVKINPLWKKPFWNNRPQAFERRVKL